jgi:hypothetical protein
LEEDIPSMWKSKATILIPDKAAFKQKSVRRDKGGHLRLIKGAVQQGDITILNTYAPNISGAPSS